MLHKEEEDVEKPEITIRKDITVLYNLSLYILKF